MPLLAKHLDVHRYIGFADDIDFDYILDSILDHAETLIDAA
jgi:hypothetical protein